MTKMYNCIPGGRGYWDQNSLDAKIWPMIARTVGLIGIAALAVAGMKCADSYVSKENPTRPAYLIQDPYINNNK